MSYTREGWRQIVSDEGFDEKGSLPTKTEFAGIVRELLTEGDGLFEALDELLDCLDNEEGNVLNVRATKAAEGGRKVRAAAEAAAKGGAG